LKIPERQGRRICSGQEDWKTFRSCARRGWGGGWMVRRFRRFGRFVCGDQENKDEIAEDEEERKTRSCFLVSFLCKSTMSFLSSFLWGIFPTKFQKSSSFFCTSMYRVLFSLF
jgi:hypothetical protein